MASHCRNSLVNKWIGASAGSAIKNIKSSTFQVTWPFVSIARILCFTTLLFFSSCRDKYEAPLSARTTNYLVVEGFINANGFTNITLRRSTPLRDTARLKAETNAQVTILSEDNSQYNVGERGNGSYMSDSLVLRLNQKYRLRIKTKSGGEYLSAYVVVVSTPKIDSISWRVENNGVQIYANTHDPQNNTRYYKWDYGETWEIHSAFETIVKYVSGNVVVPRDLDEIPKLYYCWKYNNSSSIILGSSAKLTSDVISLAPVTFFPLTSERLGVRYSILVKQYSLDREGYDFYQRMKSNTESLGSIFDAQPSEITGNITCVSNPSEKVIGYINASTVDQKRIFILPSQVGGKFRMQCEEKLVTIDSVKFYFESQALEPYRPDGFPIKGYFSSTSFCIDCRTRGTNIKPSFW